MADPADLVRAWQDAVRQLRKVAAPNLDQSTLRQLVAPLNARRRSSNTPAGRVRRPARPTSARPHGELRRGTQPDARGNARPGPSEAAALSFKQAAERLEAQAAVMERAISTNKAPTDLLKSIGGLADSEASEDEPSENKPTRRR